MDFENSFVVGAPPTLVYEYLVDVERIVTCIPGAELVELLPDNGFTGRVKIRLGPVLVTYNGTGRLAGLDAITHTAHLEGQGREVAGSGTVAAKARLEVLPEPTGSRVIIRTDVAVGGKAAQFGRGVLNEVSKGIVAQLAKNLSARIDSDEALGSAPPAPGARSGTQLVDAERDDEGMGKATLGPRAVPRAASVLNVRALVWSMLKARVFAFAHRVKQMRR